MLAVFRYSLKFNTRYNLVLAKKWCHCLFLFFIVFIGLGKSSERSEKKSLGSKCVSIAPDSKFEFLFVFITVQIAMARAVNWEKNPP